MSLQLCEPELAAFLLTWEACAPQHLPQTCGLWPAQDDARKCRQFLQAWLCHPRNRLCAGKHEVRYDSGDVQELTLRHEAVLWPELPPNPAWPAAGVGALPEARPRLQQGLYTP